MKELLECWKNMSEEEHVVAVGNGVEELVKRCKNQKEGIQNLLINSFHDMWAMLAKIQQKASRLLFSWSFLSCPLSSFQLKFLAGHMGMCILTITVHLNLESYNAPFVFISEPHILQYFETLMKKTLQDLMMGLEGFIILGITCKCQTAYYIINITH